MRSPRQWRVEDTEHFGALGINGLVVDDVREGRLEKLVGDTGSHRNCEKIEKRVTACLQVASDSQTKAGTRSHGLELRIRGINARGLFWHRCGGGGAQSFRPVTPLRRFKVDLVGCHPLTAQFAETSRDTSTCRDDHFCFAAS